MKIKKTLAIILVIGFIVFAIFVSHHTIQNFTEDENSFQVSIVSWNLKIFGDAKASNQEFMSKYAKIITMHDVAIIQEIRDSDSSSFYELCTIVNSRIENENAHHTCLISSRAGTSISKEQYGIFVRNITFHNQSILVAKITDYNIEKHTSQFERPPYEITLKIENYSIKILTIHTKPENTPKELYELESIIQKEKDNTNTIIIGDLNADCSYYNRQKEKNFKEWKWIISDDKDTTTGKSNCAYDRIIANKNSSKEIIRATIYNSIEEKYSDHYPVSVILTTMDK